MKLYVIRRSYLHFLLRTKFNLLLLSVVFETLAETASSTNMFRAVMTTEDPYVVPCRLLP